MSYIVKYAAYSLGSPFMVLARDLDGRETFIGTFHSREAAEDKCDELQDAYNHGTNYFHGGE
jgi:hypothetical protein